MTQLVSKEPLIVLHIRSETNGPKRSAAGRQQVPDTPLDEKVDKMVMQRPPRVMATGGAPFDQTDSIVDHSRSSCKRVTTFVSRGDERHFCGSPL